MTAPNILVFDSGIGGLSVVAAIASRLPNCHFHYLADNAHFPYGSLSDDMLIRRVTHLITAAVHKHTIDLIVIACNTASTLVLNQLRAAIAIPIVGVVPAIKPAAAQTRTGHIGLLATPATVRRKYTDELIANFASHIVVHRIGSEALVALAESQSASPAQQATIIQAELAPWQAYDIDIIVLACTHFPLLKPALAEVVGSHVKLLDSGDAIARRVVQLLERQPAVSDGAGSVAYFTHIGAIDASRRKLLSHYGFTRIEAFDDH